MKPSDYCEKWVPIFYKIQPGDRGYKKKCIEELVRVTTLAPETIERSWGRNFEKAPTYIDRMLDYANALNQAAQTLPSPLNFDS